MASAMNGDDKPGKDLDIAVIMGGKPKPSDAESKKPEGNEPEGDGLPAGFEEAFSEAFPEAAGDTDRMMALKRLIHLCSDAY